MKSKRGNIIGFSLFSLLIRRLMDSWVRCVARTILRFFLLKKEPVYQEFDMNVLFCAEGIAHQLRNRCAKDAQLGSTPLEAQSLRVCTGSFNRI